MTTGVATATRIYVSYLDLSGNGFKVDTPLKRAMKDSTTFNDGGYYCCKPSLMSGSAAIDAYQDWAAGVLDDQISIGSLGTQYPLTVVPNLSGTVAAADPALFSRGVLSSANPLDGLKAEMAKGHLGFDFDTAILRGQVALPSAAQTASGTGTAVLLTGPTASQSLYAALHVFAYTGFTNVVFKVQSDDNSGFTSATDRITFPTVTGLTSQYTSVAGAFNTETYQRAQWTVTGTGSITAALVFGVI